MSGLFVEIGEYRKMENRVKQLEGDLEKANGLKERFRKAGQKKHLEIKKEIEQLELHIENQTIMG